MLFFCVCSGNWNGSKNCYSSGSHIPFGGFLLSDTTSQQWELKGCTQAPQVSVMIEWWLTTGSLLWWGSAATITPRLKANTWERSEFPKDACRLIRKGSLRLWQRYLAENTFVPMNGSGSAFPFSFSPRAFICSHFRPESLQEWYRVRHLCEHPWLLQLCCFACLKPPWNYHLENKELLITLWDVKNPQYRDNNQSSSH